MIFERKDIITAVEIGTSKVCVLIGETDSTDTIQIIGHGEVSLTNHSEAPTEGAVCKGEIVDMNIVIEALSEAVEEAESSAEQEIDRKNIYIAVTGSHIFSQEGQGSVIINEDDRRITDEHINEAIRNAQNIPLPFDKVVINSFDSYFMIDGNRRGRNPSDQVANKLEAYIHIISGDRNRIDNFKSILHDVGFDNEPIPVFSGVASAYGVLTDEERENGVLLIDSGAGTTESMVIQNGGVIYSGVMPIGVEHVVNDLALGLELSTAVARKMLLGIDISKQVEDGVIEVVSGFLKGTTRRIPISSIDKIIDLRIRELYKIIFNEIESRNLLRAIRAGIVVTGGGVHLPHCQRVIKSVFDAPVRIGKPIDTSGAVTAIDFPRYSTVWGLLRFGDFVRKVEGEVAPGLLEKLSSALSKGIFKPFKRNLVEIKDSIKF